MVYHSNQPKIILTVVAILFVASAIVFFAVMPGLRKVSARQAELVSSQTELAAIDRKIESFSQARAELRKVSLQYPDIVGLFSAREDLATVVAGLEDAAARAGVIMDLVITDRLEEAAKAPAGRQTDQKVPLLAVAGLANVEEVPFKATLSGDYNSLLKFFEYFDHIPYLTKITNLDAVADKTQVSQSGEEPKNTGAATGKVSGVFFMRAAQ